MHTFSDVPSFSKISKPTYQNHKIGKQCFLLSLFFKISLRDTFHISYGFISLQNAFSDLYFAPCRGKFFSIYGVHIPRKCIESLHFYSCPSSTLKTPARIFLKSVSPKTEEVEEAMICSIKIQSEDMKMTWNIFFLFYFIFFIFFLIFLNVMVLQFWK